MWGMWLWWLIPFGLVVAIVYPLLRSATRDQSGGRSDVPAKSVAIDSDNEIISDRRPPR